MATCSSTLQKLGPYKFLFINHAALSGHLLHLPEEQHSFGAACCFITVFHPQKKSEGIGGNSSNQLLQED